MAVDSCRQRRASEGTDWAAVKRAYVSDGLAVRDICRRFSIKAQTLYRRAAKEGWPRRRNGAARQSAGRASVMLLDRLRRLAEDQMSDIEAERAARTRPAGPTRQAHDVRLLGELMGLIERMAAVERDRRVADNGQ